VIQFRHSTIKRRLDATCTVGDYILNFRIRFSNRNGKSRGHFRIQSRRSELTLSRKSHHTVLSTTVMCGCVRTGLNAASRTKFVRSNNDEEFFSVIQKTCCVLHNGANDANLAKILARFIGSRFKVLCLRRRGVLP
jgi:hypothetical protein